MPEIVKVPGKSFKDYFQIDFWTPCVVHTFNLALKNIYAARHES